MSAQIATGLFFSASNLVTSSKEFMSVSEWASAKPLWAASF